MAKQKVVKATRKKTSNKKAAKKACNGKCDEITIKNTCILWGCILAFVLVVVVILSYLIPLAKEKNIKHNASVSPELVGPQEESVQSTNN